MMNQGFLNFFCDIKNLATFSTKKVNSVEIHRHMMNAKICIFKVWQKFREF